jgi:hypothetical protein
MPGCPAMTVETFRREQSPLPWGEGAPRPAFSLAGTTGRVRGQLRARLSAMTVETFRTTLPSSLPQTDTMSLPALATTTVVTLKMNDRCGNIIENKGPAFDSPGRSGKVVENKGSYSFKTGMLLKTHELNATWILRLCRSDPAVMGEESRFAYEPRGRGSKSSQLLNLRLSTFRLTRKNGKLRLGLESRAV